jgi:hypothetical protein
MTTTQNRIKRVSAVFRLLFQALLVAVPVVHILAWLNAPTPIDISGNLGFFVSVVPKGIEILSPLSTTTKLYGFAVSSVPVIIIEFMLYFLMRLFKLYERAEIFSLANVNYLKKIGYALLITQLSRIVCNGFLSMILTWHNPPHGKRVLVLTIATVEITAILTAFLVILISWIMAEGCRLREEQQLTI